MATDINLEDNDEQEQQATATLKQNGVPAIIEWAIGTTLLVTSVVVCYFMDKNNTYGTNVASDTKTQPQLNVEGTAVQIRLYALGPIVTGVFVLSEGIVIHFCDHRPITTRLPIVLQFCHLLRVLIALTMFLVLIGSLLESSGQPHCTLAIPVLTALCLAIWFNRLRKIVRHLERIVGSLQGDMHQAAAVLTGLT